MKIVFKFFLLFFIALGHAKAALYDRGNGQVYDSTLGITWSKDLDLFNTLSGKSVNYENFIHNIINANEGFVIDNNFYGYSVTHQLTQGDFGASNDWGTFPGIFYGLTWWGAKAFATYLNKIDFLGSDSWSLPDYLPINNPSSFPIGFNAANCDFICGRFMDATSGKFSNFEHVNWGPYWLNTGITWSYVPTEVNIGIVNKSSGYGAWYIHLGDATLEKPPVPTPIPKSFWLFSTVLFLWRRKKPLGGFNKLSCMDN